MATHATKLPGIERPPVENFSSFLRNESKGKNVHIISTLGQIGRKNEAVLSIDLLCDKGEFKQVDHIINERVREMFLSPSSSRATHMAVVKYGLKKLHNLDKMWAVSMKTAHEIFCFPDADLKDYYKALLV